MDLQTQLNNDPEVKRARLARDNAKDALGQAEDDLWEARQEVARLEHQFELLTDEVEAAKSRAIRRIALNEHAGPVAVLEFPERTPVEPGEFRALFARLMDAQRDED